MNDLTEWGKTCGLKFNPEKSVAVIFSRRRKIPPFSLRIDGGEIEYKTEVKYLGVTLDSKLHWNKHVEEKITKTKRYLSKVASMTRKNWGPKPKLMRWAYIGIVRPMLCYGAMIWGHRAPELMEKLRRINRMAINTFASFPKSTPTVALEVMLDIQPLHLFCVQEALAARVRLDKVLEFGWHGTSHTKHHSLSHMKFMENKLKEYKINPTVSDKCSTLKWNTGFKINWDSFDGRSKHRQQSQYNIYTDGSKMDDQTGAGMAIFAKGQEMTNDRCRLPNGTTVFQAEVTAIKRAAERMTEIDRARNGYVKIFIDSQAAIAAVGNPRVTSRVVAEAIDKLNDLANFVKSVTLVWIPAHKGHVGNERADVLAKEGSQLPCDSNTAKVHTPHATIKAEIKENIKAEWEKEWRELTIANHSRSFYAKPSAKKAKYVYKLARLELGRFIRIITGHNNLNFFQEKLGLTHRATCRLCESGQETITHFTTECPRLQTWRTDILKAGTPTNDMKWSVRELLEFSYIPAINEAYEGTWNSSDPPSGLDETLGLEWLGLDGNDENNNYTPEDEATN